MAHIDAALLGEQSTTRTLAARACRSHIRWLDSKGLVLLIRLSTESLGIIYVRGRMLYHSFDAAPAREVAIVSYHVFQAR